MQPSENQELLQNLESALKERRVESVWPQFVDYFTQRLMAGQIQEALSMVRRASAAGLKGEILQDALSRRAELLSFAGDYGDEFDECVRQVFQGSQISAKSRALRALGRSHLSAGDATTGEAFLRSSADQQGVTPEERMESLYELGIGLDAAGHHEGAVRALKEVLAIAEEWAVHPEDAQSEPKAEAKAADKREVTLPSGFITGLILHTKAILALWEGQLPQAEQDLRQAITEIEAARGRFHPSFSAALHSLATLCRLENRPGAAEPVLKLCTAINEALFGQAHNEFASSLAELAVALYHQGRPDEALAYLQKVVEIYDKNLAQGLRVAQAQEFYAMLQLRQGDPHLAEPWAIKALDLYQKVNHMPGQISALRMLSEIFLHQGKLKESELFAERAKTWAQAHLETDHPLQASTHFTHGLALESLGRYEEALQDLRWALAESQRLGLDHLQIAACMHNIGGILGHQGQYAEAEEMLQNAMSLEADRATPASTAQSLATLGGLRACRAHYAEAEADLTRALALSEQAYPMGHPERISIRTALADVQDRAGRLQEAWQLLKAGQREAEAEAAENHPAAALWYAKLGHFQSEFGHYAEAEEAVRKALRMTEAAVGAGHPDVNALVRSLAGVRAARGDYAEAVKLATEALEADERAFGAHHPATSNARYTWAQMQLLNGDPKAAEAALTQVLEDDSAFLEADHPELAQDHVAHARALDGLGRYAEAETEAQAALEAFQRRLGAKHPESCAARLLLGHLLHRQDRDGELEAQVRPALEGLLAAYGETHPDVALAYGLLGSALGQLGQFEQAHGLASQGLKLTDDIYGLHHPLRVQMLSRLATITLLWAEATPKAQAQVTLADAEILAREACSLSDETLGARNPEAGVAPHLYARILMRAQKYDKAAQFAALALQLKQSAWPDDHPEVALTVSLQGQIAAAQKQYADALPLLQKAAKLLKAALGPNHRETKEAARVLRAAKRALKQAEPPSPSSPQ